MPGSPRLEAPRLETVDEGPQAATMQAMVPTVASPRRSLREAAGVESAIRGLEGAIMTLSNQVQDMDREMRKASYMAEGAMLSPHMMHAQQQHNRRSTRTNSNRRISSMHSNSSGGNNSNPNGLLTPISPGKEGGRSQKENEKNRVRAFSELATEEYNKGKGRMTPPWVKLRRAIKRLSLGKVDGDDITKGFGSRDSRKSITSEGTSRGVEGVIEDSAEGDANSNVTASPSQGKQKPKFQLDDEDEDDDQVSGMFLPDGSFRYVWDTLYLFCLLFEVTLWSVVIFSSGSDYDGDPSITSTPLILCLRILASCFWFADMHVQTRTAKLIGWEIIESPDILKKLFLKKRLPFDGFVSLPVDIVLAFVGYDLLGYWWMSVRVLRLYRVFDLFGHSTPTRETSKLVESWKFSFWCLIAIQIASCIWLNRADDSEQGLDEGEVEDLKTKYIKSVYFTFTTLSSVGYGDMSPKTNDMRIFNIVIQFLGLAIIMVVSGRTGAYFITTDPYKLVLLDRKRRLEHLMAGAEVPWNIQKEAFSIYPSLLDTGSKDYQSMLLELPEFIQTKISSHIKVRAIGTVPMFRGLSRKLLAHLADVLVEEYHGSKEHLIRSGEIGEEMYILNQGMVEVLLPAKDDPGREVWVATLKTGSWFGEIALLKSTLRTASVRSVTSCQLFKLNRTDLESMLESSEELRTRMKEETERRLRDQSGAGAKEKTGDGKSVLNRILRRWKVADNASVHNETEEAEEMEEVEEVEEVEETEDETTGSLDSGAVMPVKIPALSRNTSLALGGGEEDEDSELPPNIITSTSSTSSDCLADRKISTVVTESGPLESSGSRDANPLKSKPDGWRPQVLQESKDSFRDLLHDSNHAKVAPKSTNEAKDVNEE